MGQYPFSSYTAYMVFSNYFPTLLSCKIFHNSNLLILSQLHAFSKYTVNFLPTEEQRFAMETPVQYKTALYFPIFLSSVAPFQLEF